MNRKATTRQTHAASPDFSSKRWVLGFLGLAVAELLFSALALAALLLLTSIDARPPRRAAELMPSRGSAVAESFHGWDPRFSIVEAP